MKKIAMSLATIAAVAMLAVGATGAYFTDQETVSGMTFATGTLEVRNDTPGWSNVSFTNLKPGDSIRKWVVLTNTGSLDVDLLTVTKTNVIDTSGLLAQISVSGWGSVAGSDPAYFTPDWTAPTNVAAWFSNSDVLDTSFYRTAAGVIHPGETYTMGFDFTVPATLGNEWQGQTASFDLQFNAEQSHAGNSYF